MPAVVGQLGRTCGIAKRSRNRAKNSSGKSAAQRGASVTGIALSWSAADAQTRAFFEPRFGHDFSQVRYIPIAVPLSHARG
jgi:hypothetical protein